MTQFMLLCVAIAARSSWRGEMFARGAVMPPALRNYPKTFLVLGV